MNRNELKKKMLEIISSERLLTNSRRIETICRAQINRLSHTMILGDRCITLEKDDKKVTIESRCGKNNDGYGRLAYITAYNEAKKILSKLRIEYEKIIRVDKQAV